jgi:pilus assembly protein Flp/PilA
MTLFRRLRNFWKTEDGPTAVEYAVILGLILTMCLTTISRVGTKVRRDYRNIRTSLP